MDIKTKKDLAKLLALWKKNPTSERTATVYKFTNSSRHSPYGYMYSSPAIYYKIGRVVRVARNRCNTLEYALCGAGINVATEAWAKSRSRGGVLISLRIRVCDIVAIPFNGKRMAGKFRVCRAEVLT